jgi:hypothetical protein
MEREVCGMCFVGHASPVAEAMSVYCVIQDTEKREPRKYRIAKVAPAIAQLDATTDQYLNVEIGQVT